MKCCYEKQAYSINTTISFGMSKDGCVRAAIDCVEETPGNAKMVLRVENYCKDYATQQHLAEIKEILLEETSSGSKCQKDNIHAKDEKEGIQFYLDPFRINLHSKYQTKSLFQIRKCYGLDLA